MCNTTGEGEFWISHSRSWHVGPGTPPVKLSSKSSTSLGSGREGEASWRKGGGQPPPAAGPRCLASADFSHPPHRPGCSWSCSRSPLNPCTGPCLLGSPPPASPSPTVPTVTYGPCAGLHFNDVAVTALPPQVSDGGLAVVPHLQDTPQPGLARRRPHPNLHPPKDRRAVGPHGSS